MIAWNIYQWNCQTYWLIHFWRHECSLTENILSMLKYSRLFSIWYADLSYFCLQYTTAHEFYFQSSAMALGSNGHMQMRSFCVLPNSFFGLYVIDRISSFPLMISIGMAAVARSEAHSTSRLSIYLFLNHSKLSTFHFLHIPNWAHSIFCTFWFFCIFHFWTFLFPANSIFCTFHFLHIPNWPNSKLSTFHFCMLRLPGKKAHDYYTLFLWDINEQKNCQSF